MRNRLPLLIGSICWCVAGVWGCSKSPGRAASGAALGAVCAQDSDCAESSCSGAPGVCGGFGAACSTAAQCNALRCLAGHCTVRSLMGESCASHADCAAGQCSVDDAVTAGGLCGGVDAPCAVMEDCAGGVCIGGLCAELAGLGGRCDDGGDCAAGACSVTDGHSPGGLCGGAGASCTGDAACYQGHCIGGVCYGRAGLGGVCVASAHCAEGLACSVLAAGVSTGICGGTGASCSDEADCHERRCIAGVCTGAADLGGACNDNGDCLRGACSPNDATGAGVCGGLDAACAADAACFQLRCIRGQCRALAGLGEACDTAGDCAQGACSVNDGVSSAGTCGGSGAACVNLPSAQDSTQCGAGLACLPLAGSHVCGAPSLGGGCDGGHLNDCPADLFCSPSNPAGSPGFCGGAGALCNRVEHCAPGLGLGCLPQDGTHKCAQITSGGACDSGETGEDPADCPLGERCVADTPGSSVFRCGTACSYNPNIHPISGAVGAPTLRTAVTVGDGVRVGQSVAVYCPCGYYGAAATWQCTTPGASAQAQYNGGSPAVPSCAACGGGSYGVVPENGNLDTASCVTCSGLKKCQHVTASGVVENRCATAASGPGCNPEACVVAPPGWKVEADHVTTSPCALAWHDFGGCGCAASEVANGDVGEPGCLSVTPGKKIDTDTGNEINCAGSEGGYGGCGCDLDKTPSGSGSCQCPYGQVLDGAECVLPGEGGGPTLWLDAAHIGTLCLDVACNEMAAADQAPLAAWLDRVNGRVFVADVEHRPHLERGARQSNSAVQFDFAGAGTQALSAMVSGADLWGGSDPTGKNFTIFLVLRAAQSANAVVDFNGGGSEHGLRVQAPTADDKLSVDAPTTGGQFFWAGTSENFIAQHVYYAVVRAAAADDTRLFRNGLELTVDKTGYQDPSPSMTPWLAEATLEIGKNFSGELLELIVYDRILTHADDLDDLHAYLAAKWFP